MQRDEPQFPDAPRPTGDSSNGKIILAWNAVDDVDSYKIYRSDSADGEYAQIGAVSETTYEDKNVTANETYFYKVTSVNADNRENDLVQPISVTCVPSQPEIRFTLQNLRSGDTIADAKLEVKSEGFSDTAKTDAYGNCTIKLKYDGVYVISASKKGYISKSIEKRLRAQEGTAQHVEILLCPEPQVTHTIQSNTEPFNFPIRIAFLRDGTRAYVTNQLADNVSVINAINDDVITQISVGRKPTGIATNPKNDEVYVANRFDDTITIIDGIHFQKSEPIKVGNSPVDLVASSDGKKLYVVNELDNTISVVNIEGGSEETTIQVGQQPQAIAINPNEPMLYVANERSDSISVVHATLETEIDVISGVIGPTALAISPNGTYLYVANTRGNNISVIDTGNNENISTIETGISPRGVAVVDIDDKELVFVVNHNDNNITLIDFPRSDFQPLSIPVGAFPIGIATSPDEKKLYIANSVGANVSVMEF